VTKCHALIAIAFTAAFIGGGCRSKSNDKDPLVSGIGLLESGSIEAARDVLIEATALYTNSASAHCNLGIAYWKLGDNNAAIASLSRACELAEGDSRPQEFLANVLIDAGNVDGAHKILLNVENPTASTLTLMGVTAYRAGSSDLARSYLGQALQLNDNYSPALYNLALLCRDVYKIPREALSYYKRFQTASPNDRRAAETPQAFISLGEDAPPADEPSTPVPPPQPPVAVAPKPKPTPPPSEDVDIVRQLLATADLELNRGNADIALLTLKGGVNKYPNNADLIWALIQLYKTHLGDAVRATNLHQKFSRMFPNDARAIKTAPQASTTTTTPETSAALPPGEAAFRAGLDHYANHTWDEAIIAYQKALREDPKSSRTAYNLGLAYKANGDLDRAAKSFTVALILQKDMPKALYMLGLTEMQQGQNKGALAHLNRLIRVQPDFAKAHYLLGRIYRDENRPDMALIHFERFLHLAPMGTSADYARQWVEQHKTPPQE